ncbi:alpha/beta fold hydrolase [Hamadaea tsunoensis]|uniref:alpha/beta fold hydrolase n=1 Tax=Hamadaea tsunoensis TaxID=53368 RepID=UPI0006843CB7|nr:alpha/beta hydrolase [Hamadaea tsunoensis]
MTDSLYTPSGIAYDASAPREGGLPVVLIHAGIADRRMWDPILGDLSADRTVVRVDLRGYGASTTRPEGVLDHVADVVSTLEHLRITRCHLVGASFGSGVATEVALTRPDLAQSLLLCPPGGSLLAELTPDLRAFFDAEKAALAGGDLDAAVEANVTSWVAGPGRDVAEVEPSVVSAVREMQRNVFEIAEAWGDVDQAELEPPALERLNELDLPVLVLVGGHDLDTTHDAARRVCAGAPQARRVDWDDVAHLPSMERPAEFAALVRGWTTEHDPS